MSDFTEFTADKPANKPRGKPLAKGYDPRRWLHGAPKKPKDKKRAEEILLHVIWDVLSEEITNPNTGEAIDRLRAMVRSMTTSRQSADKQALLDRIAGKVTSPVDVTSKGEQITNTKEIYDSVIAKLGLSDETTETPEDTNPTPE